MTRVTLRDEVTRQGGADTENLQRNRVVLDNWFGKDLLD